MYSYSIVETVSVSPAADYEKTTRAFVISVPPIKVATTLMQFSEQVPLERYGLTHLKRVQKDRDSKSDPRIIVCQVAEYEMLPDNVKSFCSEMNLHVVDVAKYPPRSRIEFEALSVYWPLNFHMSQIEKDREKGFDAAATSAILAGWRALLDEEERMRQLSKVYPDVKAKAGLIINPANGAIVSTSSKSFQYIVSTKSSGSGSRLALHPLYTPTMLCIDGVASVVAGLLDGQGKIY
jgi:hypothetical protein